MADFVEGTIRGRWTPLAHAIAAAVIVLTHLAANPFYHLLDEALLGTRYALAGALLTAPTTDRVTVVAIDGPSLRAVPGRWPWSRRVIAQGLAALAGAGPRVIGVDLFFANPAAEDPGQDAVLEDTLRAAGNVVLVTNVEGDASGMRFRRPAPAFARAAAGIACPPLATGATGDVTRLIQEAGRPPIRGLVAELLRVGAGLGPGEVLRTAGTMTFSRAPPPAEGPLALALDEQGAIPVDYRYLDAVARLPFHRLLDGDFDPALVRDRFVLVGVTSRRFPDHHDTPRRAAVGGVEIHASALASTLAGTTPSAADPALVLVLLGLLGGLLAAAGRRLGPGAQVGVAALVATSWWWGSLTVFMAELVHVPLARPTGMFGLLLLAGLLRHRFRPQVVVREDSARRIAEAREALARGRDALEAGNPAQAVAHLQAGIELDTPLGDELRVALIGALLARGDGPIAHRLADEVDPDALADEHLYDLAVTLEARGELHLASRFYRVLAAGRPAPRDAAARLEELERTVVELGDVEVAQALALEILHPRYRDVELLGHGAMGFVFRARDTEREGAFVALKVLSPFFANAPLMHERFVREARLVAGIESPHVVRILDIHEVSLPYYSMDYIESVELKAILDAAPGRRLAPGRAARLVAEAALGVGAAHEGGVVHRDVKPANILVDTEDRAVVIDFGLARVADATRLTSTGQAVGTLLYMAPEQIRGSEVTAATDVYALGLVLYEALAGSLPFGPADDRSGPAPHLPGSVEVAEGLETVLRGALSPDLVSRHPDGGALAAALAPFVD